MFQNVRNDAVLHFFIQMGMQRAGCGVAFDSLLEAGHFRRGKTFSGKIPTL